MSTSPGMYSSHFCRVRLTSGSCSVLSRQGSPQLGEMKFKYLYLAAWLHGAGLEISGDFHEGLVYIDKIGECSRVAWVPVRVVTVRLLLKCDPDFTRRTVRIILWQNTPVLLDLRRGRYSQDIVASVKRLHRSTSRTISNYRELESI